jgi:MtN3 and saliva related transmembrane protein
MIELIGFAAAVLTTLSFLPQLIKTWRTRSADDISVGMLLAFGAGVGLWLVYGLANRERPIIAANMVTLILIVAQLSLTVRFRSHSRRQPPVTPDGYNVQAQGTDE